MESSIVTELYCHNCDGYVQVKFDLTLNGRHIVLCPNCKHEHYRIIKDGIVTENRPGNISTYIVSSASTSYYATALTDTSAASTSNIFLADMWLNRYSTT